MSKALRLLCFNLAGVYVLACSSGSTANSDPSQPPNMVILLADDLGYGDLGCYGGVARTPNLDMLARKGARFTDFYAAAPNCSPSRAGFLTGRSPSKVGIYNYLPSNHPMHLKDDEITLAEVVKQKGYRTAHFGKWHLSCLPQNPSLNQPQPSDQGFDYSFGTENNAFPSHLNPVNFIRNGKSVGKLKGYSCDIVVDEAIDWLRSGADDQSPYFIYVAFHEPHKKIASPPDLIAQYNDYPREDAEYFANIENLDRAIARLLDAISPDIEAEKTLILFASDNGSYRRGSNGALLGGKSFVYEGGIRVPGILCWEGNIKPEQNISEPVGLIDFMPTICHLLDIEHPNHEQLDGQNIWPLMSQNTFSRIKPLSWFFYRTSPEISLRWGNHTILGKDNDTTKFTHAFTEPDMSAIKTMTLEEFEIYDLETDLGQERIIAISDLDEGEELQKKVLQRLKEIQDEGPIWHNLPKDTGVKKLKSNWRKLRPEGFSN